MLKLVLGLAFLAGGAILLVALRPKRGVPPGFMDSDAAAMVAAMVVTSLMASGLALGAIVLLSN
jgi:hypothetical protein